MPNSQDTKLTRTTIGTPSDDGMWFVSWGNHPIEPSTKPKFKRKLSLRLRLRYWRADRWDNLSFKLWRVGKRLDNLACSLANKSALRAEKLWGID